MNISNALGSFLKGLIDGEEIKKTPTIIVSAENINNDLHNSTNNLLTGGEEIMQYKGVKVRKRIDCKKSNWYARFMLNGEVFRVTDKTQMGCYNKLKAVLNKINRTEVLNDYTFGEWRDKWKSLYKINKVRETTLKDYSYMDKYLDGQFSKKHMKKIQPMDIIEILNGVNGDRQRQKLYEYLKDIFKRAFSNKITKDDIFVNIDKPKFISKPTKAMTREEEHAFVEACEKNRFGDLFLVALYQGLRRGEVMALRRNDIDFEKCYLRIDESENDKTSDNRTKNESSNRIMPLFEKTKELLEKYRNLEMEEKIFDISSKPVHLEFKKILENAGIQDFKIHELRHTFITRCREANIPEPVVQSWVGHVIGSKVTSSVYTHVNHEISVENSRNLDKIWTKNF